MQLLADLVSGSKSGCQGSLTCLMLLLLCFGLIRCTSISFLERIRWRFFSQICHFMFVQSLECTIIPRGPKLEVDDYISTYVIFFCFFWTLSAWPVPQRKQEMAGDARVTPNNKRQLNKNETRMCSLVVLKVKSEDKKTLKSLRINHWGALMCGKSIH